MFEACNPHITVVTHRLGYCCFFFVFGKEHPRIKPTAGTEFPPHNYFGRHNRPSPSQSVLALGEVESR
ncbi:unannotated protein [freshwater metagenome]|uniref:Unannotated protein n=1 Tax=freshwater metagenome TaxID=449393 RepID=A0A6J7F107_9ZZZZ